MLLDAALAIHSVLMGRTRMSFPALIGSASVWTAGLAWALFFCGSLSADETVAPLPQPRLRLDPTRQAAVSMPATEPKKSTGAPYMLERLVVKDRLESPIRQPAVVDTTEPFSPFKGGRFLRYDRGKVRVEVGLWTNIDIFDEEARFAGQKTKALFDFVRLKW